jgi:hypothetical protein
MKRLNLLLLVLFVGCAYGQKKILFLGNSYTYVQDIPGTLKNMATASGHTITTEQNTPGGYQLNQHYYNETSKNLINKQEWDHVVLQEQSVMPVLYFETFKWGVEKLNELIRENNPCVNNTILYQTWGRKNPLDWDFLNGEFATYADMQDGISNAYNNVGRWNGTEVAPVGEAWRKVRADGDRINLYSGDGSHQSFAGTYLAACVFYAVLFNESPVGNTYTGALSKADAGYLQQKAYESYQEYVTKGLIHTKPEQENLGFDIDIYNLVYSDKETDCCKLLEGKEANFMLLLKGGHPTGDIDISYSIKQQGKIVANGIHTVNMDKDNCKSQYKKVYINIPLKDLKEGEYSLFIEADTDSDINPENNSIEYKGKRPSAESVISNNFTEGTNSYNQDFETLDNSTDLIEWEKSTFSILSIETGDDYLANSGNSAALVYYVNGNTGTLSTTCMKFRAGAEYEVGYHYRVLKNHEASYKFTVNNGDCFSDDSSPMGLFEQVTNTSYSKFVKKFSFTKDTIIRFNWVVYKGKNSVAAIQVDDFYVKKIEEPDTPEPKVYIDKHTACDSFTWIDGNTYTESNSSAEFILKDIAGRDSVVRLNLIIKRSSFGVDNQRACAEFRWIDGVTYTESNNSAKYTLVNSVGCDSIVSLNLIIDNADNSITNNNGTFVANQDNATYQWVDCNNGDKPIAGATGKEFKPTITGSYAVQISKGMCKIVSDCVEFKELSTAVNSLGNEIYLYPNPTEETVNIVLKQAEDVVINQRDMSGRLIATYISKDKRIVSVNLKGNSGMYLLEIIGSNTYIVKVVKGR